MHKKDDYFAILGLRPGASTAQIRAAYRESAKLHHPDVTSGSYAAGDFERITAAHEALMRLHRTDGPSVRRIAPEERSHVPRPLRCSDCKMVTVVPHYSTATSVKSFLVFSGTVKSEGVLCASCLKRQMLRANLISGLLGWWSVQGLFLTPLHIYRNLFRSTPDARLDHSYLCHNLLAFDALGYASIVRRIADVLARSSSTLPLKIRYITDKACSEDGYGVKKLGGGEDWRLSPSFAVANIAAAASGPVGVLLLWVCFTV